MVAKVVDVSGAEVVASLVENLECGQYQARGGDRGKHASYSGQSGVSDDRRDGKGRCQARRLVNEVQFVDKVADVLVIIPSNTENRRGVPYAVERQSDGFRVVQQRERDRIH